MRAAPVLPLSLRALGVPGLLALLVVAGLGGSGLSPAWATGFGGTDAPSRIPVPARVFSAQVEDLSGTTVDVTRVSFDGEVYLYGQVGEGTVAIPFENLDEVRIEPLRGDGAHRLAYATLRDGGKVKVQVEHDVPCYGDTSYGHYRIEVDRIRRIVFRHDADAPRTVSPQGGKRPTPTTDPDDGQPPAGSANDP